MAKKARLHSDGNGSVRQRGLNLLLGGMLLCALWAGGSLLFWGIATVLFGQQSFPWILVEAGAAGIVLMLAGSSMGITGVAIDRITVPSWLSPEKNRLSFQIFVFLLIMLAVWVHIRFF